MSLVLEIDHLLGVAFAAQSPASPLPDWPPQPDRIFSALVAAFAARGQRAEERAALEWLEAAPAPEIDASDGCARSAATVFTPPNDPQSGRIGDRSVMPALRRRQARRFPAFLPHDPCVRLIWRNSNADAQTLASLNALAADTPYVGHSASLTRCRFSLDATSAAGARPAERTIYRGRLVELESAFAAGRRPTPGEASRVAPGAAASQVPHRLFARRWLVLEHVSGEMPDLRGAALVARALREAIMSGYAKAGLSDAIPAIMSGHAADGAPLAGPHLAVVPLAFVGWPHADGRTLGFALVPPGEGDLLDDADFQKAVKAVAAWNDAEGRRELNLTANGFNLRFAVAREAGLRSLDPAPYLGPARRWASATPIVLDRHLKAKSGEALERELMELIAAACRNIGLPEPARIKLSGGGEGFAITAGKHSAVAGAPSAYPSGRAPRWTGWRLPKSLESRRLAHAVIAFGEPVSGPVLLGAGRFCGLGLCRAFDEERR